MSYDAIGILAERLGSRIGEPENRTIIMSPLLDLHQRYEDDDKELQPLFACFAVLATSLGKAFEEYTVPIFERCVRILNTQLQAFSAEESGISGSPADSSFIISALDLISGLIEGVGASSEFLVHQAQLSTAVYCCCESPDSDIRQSAFALLGEMAKICPSHIRPRNRDFCTLCVNNFAHEMLIQPSLSASNNACWALGEIAINCTREELQPMALKIVESSVNVLVHARCLPRNLSENAAISLGRVALVCAQDVASHLHHFVGIWCEMLRNIRDDIEKEQAFSGLMKTVALNLNAAAYSFPSLCAAVASWSRGMPEALKSDIRNIMQRLRQLLESRNEWDGVWAGVEPTVQEKLQNPHSW